MMNCLKKLVPALAAVSQMTYLLAAAGPGTALAPASTKSDGPRIQFSETTYDFGKVNPTDTLRHIFMATNLGNAVLKITDVHTGCGCTTDDEWDNKILQGQDGKIPIQFTP